MYDKWEALRSLGPEWKTLRAIRRWWARRMAQKLDADPRNLLLVTRNPHGAAFKRRVFVLGAVCEWMNVCEKWRGDGFPISHFEVDAVHSSLLPWLVEGNAVLPYPPPKRHSSPDHRMILEGRGEFHEVWVSPHFGAVVDQGRDWTLVEQPDPKVIVFDQKYYGRWYFYRTVAKRRGIRTNEAGERVVGEVDYECWAGVSDYHLAAKVLSLLLT